MLILFALLLLFFLAIIGLVFFNKARKQRNTLASPRPRPKKRD